eukprot:TRINITY_DN21279_c0_g1_i1.p1 TRINITY_DN21279_c0_g1~~TRINITY_DN21279_c0_g1_i1.p1  ORF type:complete len:105 (+),score=15.36 TRINITY_DN21279_c0_g1_i1:2-316(+)
MNMASNSSVKAPAPPERGSFPLDHKGECRETMMAYLSCLRKNNSDSYICKPEAATYLNCRIDKGLMAPDDLEALGFKTTNVVVVADGPRKESTGFVAGIRRKRE